MGESTLTPMEFREELLGEVLQLALDISQEYAVVYKLGFGSRRSGVSGGSRGEHSDPTYSVNASGARARGACRIAARRVRDVVRPRSGKKDSEGKRSRDAGALVEALAVLLWAQGLDDVPTTDAPGTPKSETRESIAARAAVRRERERDRNPLTGEARWGDF